jgi:hypothetical protein
MRGRCHFQRSPFRIRAVDVVPSDDDVFQALPAPFGGDIVGEFVVALRSGDVGFGGEDAVLAALFVGTRDGFEFGFDPGFVGGGGGGETEDGLGVGEGCCEKQDKTGCGFHEDFGLSVQRLTQG